MTCEHCGGTAMRGYIVCRRCWEMVIGEPSGKADK